MIDISSCLSISGWMSEVELEWLAAAASTRHTIIEVGSWTGRSTRALALHCPGVVWAVDKWESMLGDGTLGGDSILEATTRAEAAEAYTQFTKNLAPFIKNGKVNPMRMDSLEAVRQLETWAWPADMVFIDGDHSYERVKAEIDLYPMLLKPGGILSGHDLGHADVNRAVRELIPEHRAVPNTQIWWTVKG